MHRVQLDSLEQAKLEEQKRTERIILDSTRAIVKKELALAGVKQDSTSIEQKSERKFKKTIKHIADGLDDPHKKEQFVELFIHNLRGQNNIDRSNGKRKMLI